MKWCATCNGYQKAWSEVCKSHCGNDCENRCYNCNRLFSGEVTSPSYNVSNLSDSQLRTIQNSLDDMIDRSGGKNEYEYKIQVDSPSGYKITQSIVGRRK